MEAVEEPPSQDTAAEGVKVNILSCEVIAEGETIVQSDLCQKSNGVADTNDTENVQPPPVVNVVQNQLEPSITQDIEKNEPITVETEKIEPITVDKEKTENEAEIPFTEVAQNSIPASDVEELISLQTEKQNELLKNAKLEEVPEEENNEVVEDMQVEDVEVDGIVETSTENVLFETEILIENNVDDQPTKFKIIYDEESEDPTSTILSELGQNIELSEVLRSSDVADNVENNNSEVRQEVFNKEELLDILQGNDVEESKKVLTKDCKKLETQLALQQLTRLKQTKRTRKKFEKRPSRQSDSPKDESLKKKSSTLKEDTEITTDVTIEPKEHSIVNALVKDWDDDDPADGDHTKLLGEGVEILKEAEPLEGIENSIIENNDSKADVSMTDDQTPNKTKGSSEQQPQRRLSRVIKKKVIFDPDNPDTFTKTKVTIKKENQSEKELPTPKKVKVETTTLRSNSKSPVQIKSQWKKPQPKNNKKNSRLTEIDKLLMDEGAVNMICQLTPEAPKGNKNMKSKAEFIKKIQSSTPDTKEMKFRERKKELKTEDGEPNKIRKERLSLSSSVKSSANSVTAFNEEFVAAHSADDSIIYRRHSSSSYSSSCMSPMRLSDLEPANQSAVSTNPDDSTQTLVDCSANSTDVFMADSEDSTQGGVINKKDLLSIKEKLNSKLSMALNKRKRESNKIDKPSKIKRASRSSEKTVEVVVNYKYLRLTNEQKLVEICIQYPGAIYNVEVMKELKLMLESVDANKDVSVTLLTSESGSLCSGFELKPLLNQESGLSYARELAEAASSLLLTLEGHSKLVCTAVGDKCQGLGLSLLALSDVALASEAATFQLSPHNNGPLLPGTAALVASGLPIHFVKELLVHERGVSAAEARRAGLLGRALWPRSYAEQARAIARDIAAQPPPNIILKKQLLRLKRGMSGTLASDLEKERDLFVQYWTSAEGRELVRNSLGGA